MRHIIEQWISALPFLLSHPEDWTDASKVDVLYDAIQNIEQLVHTICTLPSAFTALENIELEEDLPPCELEAQLLRCAAMLKEYLSALETVSQRLWWIEEPFVKFCMYEEKKLRDAVDAVGSRFGVRLDGEWVIGKKQL